VILHLTISVEHPTCDRQTDRQTHDYSIYHGIAAVKMQRQRERLTTAAKHPFATKIQTVKTLDDSSRPPVTQYKHTHTVFNNHFQANVG